MRTSFCVTAACILLAPFARADVLVVDPAGGNGAELLQATLETAHPGDIVLLRAGDYASDYRLYVSGKGVTLVAEPGAAITLHGLEASGIPLHQTFLIRGLDFVQAPNTYYAVDTSGQGSLWMEECNSVGADAIAGADGLPTFAGAGLFANGLDLVLLARSTFLGGRGLDAGVVPGGASLPATNGGMGIYLASTKASALHEVHTTGGRGGDGVPPGDFGSGGGPGLALTSAFCAVQVSLCRGGDEGENNDPLTMSGAGASLGFSSMQIRGSSFVPGAVHGEGTPGPDISNFASVVSQGGDPCTLAIDSPVREFESARVHVWSEPNEWCWLFLSPATDGAWMPKRSGVSVIDPAWEVLPMLLGQTGFDDVLDLDFTMPALPNGMDGVVLFGQLAVVRNGKLVLGTASAVIWLSAAY